MCNIEFLIQKKVKSIAGLLVFSISSCKYLSYFLKTSALSNTSLSFFLYNKNLYSLGLLVLIGNLYVPEQVSEVLISTLPLFL